MSTVISSAAIWIAAAWPASRGEADHVNRRLVLGEPYAVSVLMGLEATEVSSFARCNPQHNHA
jgi:hypothetical protein